MDDLQAFRWLSVAAVFPAVVLCARQLSRGGRFFTRSRRAQRSPVGENRAWGWGFTMGLASRGIAMALWNWMLAVGGGVLIMAPALRFGGELVDPPDEGAG